jgi:hypothetical protein
MNIKELLAIALRCLIFNGPKKKNLSNQLSIIGIREGWCCRWRENNHSEVFIMIKTATVNDLAAAGVVSTIPPKLLLKV